MNAGEIGILEADLASMLRRGKQREEQHRRLFDYNNSVIDRRQEIIDAIFVHDQICKLKTNMQQYTLTEKTHEELDQQIMYKYDCLIDCDESVYLLVKKFASKVIQQAQVALQSLSEHVEYYSVIFNNFRILCLQFISDPNYCTPCHIAKNLANYLHHKIQVELERLRLIIKYLAQTDQHSIQDLKIFYFQRLKPKQHAKVTVNEKIQRTQVSIPTSIPLKSMSKKDSIAKSMESDKEIRLARLKAIKHEEKRKEKQRKIDFKRMKKYVTCLGQVMDICKDQLIEHLEIENKQWESRKILTQLTVRNKHNYLQISQFVDCSERLQTVPNIIIQGIQSMRELNLEGELVQERSPMSFTEKQQIYTVNQSYRKQIKYQKKDIPRSKPHSIHRQRLTVNNVDEVFQKKQKEIFNSQKKLMNEDFVEIIIKQPKQRLPDIFTRASSVDTGKATKNQAQIKAGKEEQLRKDESMKIKEVVYRGPSNNSLGRSSNQKSTPANSFGMTASNFQRMNRIGRDKVENKIRLELKTMGSNFFDEIGKRISKFCEMKKNAD